MISKARILTKVPVWRIVLKVWGIVQRDATRGIFFLAPKPMKEKVISER